MTELARTRFVESELDTRSEEKPLRSPMRSGANKTPDLRKWPNDESPDGNRSTLWPRDSFFDALPAAAQPVKADSEAKSSPSHVPARLDRAPANAVKIAIKTKGKILLINPAEILSVEAEGNYVLLRRRSDFYSLREGISNLAEKLKEYGFVRIHRSVLVNSVWVEEIFPGATGEYTLRIAGGKEYMVSRTYKTNLKWLAQSWIGTDSFVDD